MRPSALEPSGEQRPTFPPRDHWGEDREYPVSAWKYDVMEDNTRLAYWEWVDAQRAAQSDTNDRAEEA